MSARQSARSSARRGGLGLVALVAAVGLLAPLSSSASPSRHVVSAEPTIRSHDSGYSWWTEPLAARTRSSLYFTGVTSKGTQRVYRWSRAGSKNRALRMTYINLRTRKADDHNAPAISIEPGKPSLVFYAGHPGTMFVRRSATSEPVLSAKHRSAFGPERTMPFTRPVTYAQVLRDGDRVVVLTRYLGRGPDGWYYSTSGDSGRTWSAPQELFDSESHQAYLLVRPHDTDHSRLHVLAYYHPKRGPENVVGYRSMRLDDFFTGRAERFTVGAMEPVWTSAEPVVPGAPAEPGDPEDPAAEDQSVPDGDPSTAGSVPESVPESPKSVRLLDAGDKLGHTMVFVATWNAEDQVPVYVQMLRREDGTWERRPIRSAGGGYGTGSGNYIPGLALDDRTGVAKVYLGHKGGSSWFLSAADIDASGRLGLPTVLRSASVPLARPIPVQRDLLFQRLVRYRTYTDYRMKVESLVLR